MRENKTEKGTVLNENTKGEQSREKDKKQKAGIRFHSIKAKFLTVFLSIGIIMVALLIASSFLISRDIIKRYSENLLSSSIENQANEIQSWLNENLAAFQIVKHTIEGGKPNEEGLQIILNQYYGYHKNYVNGLYIADGSGKYMKAGKAPRYTEDPRDTVWYQDGLKRINMGFTKAYQNADGENIISASGILNDGSNGKKVISVDMSLQKISIIVNSFIEMKDAEAFLVDLNDSSILAHRDGKMISKSLSEFGDDAFLAGVNEKLSSRDYEMCEISNNLTAFQKIEGTSWMLVSYIPTSIVYAGVYYIRNTMLIIGAICILLLAVLIERSVHIMLRPVKEMTAAITDMANGDFTIDVKVRTDDEIGRMSQVVGQFVQSMRSMILSIQQVSASLNTESEQSYNVSQEMQEASAVQSSSMEELNATVEQLSVSVNEIAEHATTLAMVVADTKEDSVKVDKKMRETVRVSEEGKRNMNEVDDAMRNIDDSIHVLKTAIDKVSDASIEISNITAVIGDIAEETNLLSLNASIEAARAGEAGRGFAVVATQIGKLAQTSAESVETIERLVKQITVLMEDCIRQANVSEKNIHNSGDLIKVALETFNTIFDNIGTANEVVHGMIEKVEQVDDVATNVAAISEEQAASSEEILATSDTMVEQAINITKNSEVVAASAKELSRTSGELEQQIKTFKI